MTLFLSDTGVLLAKVIADFAAFIIWLEAASYCSRIVIRVEKQCASERMNNIVSSANSKWLIRGQLDAILIPGSVPFF